MITVSVGKYFEEDKLNEMALRATLNYKDLTTEEDRENGIKKGVMYKKNDTQGFYLSISKTSIKVAPWYNNDVFTILENTALLEIDFSTVFPFNNLFFGYEYGNNGKNGVITFWFSNKDIPPLTYFWGEGMDIETNNKNNYFLISYSGHLLIWEDEKISSYYDEMRFIDNANITLNSSINSGYYYSLSHYAFNNIIFTNIFEGNIYPHVSIFKNFKDNEKTFEWFESVINKFSINDNIYFQISRTTHANKDLIYKSMYITQKALLLKL